MLLDLDLERLTDDEIVTLARAHMVAAADDRFMELVDEFPRYTNADWPYDYQPVLAWRERVLAEIEANPLIGVAAKAWYGAGRPVAFTEHWCTTVDPRNAEREDRPVRMPFLLFEKQREFMEWLLKIIQAERNGLIEKCRDMGATWGSCAFSVWLWLFRPGASVGWGSRKEILVDKLGVMDSIFEKLRSLIRELPPFLVPAGLSHKDHLTFMRCLNPENGATIVGEAGDNIGRGGRTLIYFKDEAQPLGARILTPAGWQTMGDMRVGSVVLGVDGKPATVTAINDAGEHDVYRILFSDGTSALCSPNHLWTVDKVMGKRERVTRRTCEIAEAFDYVSPGGQRQFRYRVPTCEPVHFSDGPALPLDPYVVGVLLGDGSLGSGCVRLSSADEDLAAEVGRLLPSGCEIKAEGGYNYRIVDTAGRQGRKRSRARESVRAAGIAGCRAHDKRIPDAYKFARPAERLSLLQGLMDTDGSASGGVASFHSCSSTLADDVRFLVQSLGGTATLNVKPDRRGFRQMHVLHLALPAGMVPFRLERKRRQLRDRKHPPGRTIVAVEKVGREPVRCITVDREDGLYLTDHMIVTHNCAHYARPEAIEAALRDNTRVQVDISTPNGLGNVFHRRREAGIDYVAGQPLPPRTKASVFVMDWRDHPDKDEQWYADGRKKAEEEGLLHKFAQEVDRDYAASVEGVVIKAEWVRSAIDAHVKLGWKRGGAKFAGLDVADGGGDRNALAAREGPILLLAQDHGDRDTAKLTAWAIEQLEPLGRIEVEWDASGGYGTGVKAEVNRLIDEDLMPPRIGWAPWNAAGAPLNADEPVVVRADGSVDPDSPRNRDFFKNVKAQGWWELGRRFERTHRAVTEGLAYDPATLISIPSDLPNLRQIEKELCQPTMSKSTLDHKLIVDKAPEGTRSPNIGDSIMMAYHPQPSSKAIFAVSPGDVQIDPFQVPGDWKRGYAMRADPDRVTCLWGAYDAATDILYVITEHSRTHAEASINAQAIKARGDWIPGVIEATSTNRDEREQMLLTFLGYGLNLRLAERGTEAGISDAQQRIATGRLRIFSTCQQTLRDYRSFRREGSDVVGGQTMDCLRSLSRPSTIGGMAVKRAPNMVGATRGIGDAVAGY